MGLFFPSSLSCFFIIIFFLQRKVYFHKRAAEGALYVLWIFVNAVTSFCFHRWICDVFLFVEVCFSHDNFITVISSLRVWLCERRSCDFFFLFRVWERTLVPILKLKRRKVCDEWQKNRKLHTSSFAFSFFFFIVSQCIPKKEIQPLSNLDIENRRF